MNTNPDYIGIDVAKKTLAVCGKGMEKEYPNTSAGYARMIKALPANMHVVMEATGGYERGVSLALHAARIPVSVLNPRHVRDFAKAMGQLAKSDDIDAKIITRFAQIRKPVADSAPSQAQIELEEIMARRSQLVGLRMMETSRREHHRHKLLKARADKLIRILDLQIKELEAKAREIIAKESILQEKKIRMLQVEGIGEITAASVLAFIPELGTLTRAQAAALLGVAPFVCESGMERGKRHIWGGRAQLRACLYMAAMTAMRDNRILSEFYRRLRDAGKPGKVAIVAVMRKLICLLNHMLKKPQFSLA